MSATASLEPSDSEEILEIKEKDKSAHIPYAKLKEFVKIINNDLNVSEGPDIVLEQSVSIGASSLIAISRMINCLVEKTVKKALKVAYQSNSGIQTINYYLVKNRFKWSKRYYEACSKFGVYERSFSDILTQQILKKIIDEKFKTKIMMDSQFMSFVSSYVMGSISTVLTRAILITRTIGKTIIKVDMIKLGARLTLSHGDFAVFASQIGDLLVKEKDEKSKKESTTESTETIPETPQVQPKKRVGRKSKESSPEPVETNPTEVEVVESVEPAPELPEELPTNAPVEVPVEIKKDDEPIKTKRTYQRKKKTETTLETDSVAPKPKATRGRVRKVQPVVETPIIVSEEDLSRAKKATLQVPKSQISQEIDEGLEDLTSLSD